MCGLAGLFDLRGDRPVDRGLVRAMTDALTHRGPDDSGYLIEPGVGLGHRRLSIIDLAGGHQPIFNEDDSVAVVFNGEIYNFQDLMSELTALGHRFKTRSDTETIVHAWEEWGEACVERLRGMFAFALYDRARGCVFLARDRLGIKPLYYSCLPDGRVIFGSELKALLVHPDLDRTLDPRAVEDFFALGYVPDPRSIYRAAAKLPPGHTLLLRRGDAHPVPRCYWTPCFEGDVDGPLDALGDELMARMSEAVRLRMIADVPLGAFLSGGVDSSAVVAMMSTLQDEPVNTCNISFGEKAFDEAPYARAMADRYHTRHHSRTVDPNDFDLVADLPRVYDEPFADSSALPTYRVCEEARRHVKVALSGDGGDEVFIGYRRYRWHHYEERVRRRLPQALRGPLFGLAGRLYPKMDWAPRPLRAKATLQALARNSADGYFHSVSLMPNDLRERLYSPAMKRNLQGYRTPQLFAEHLADAPSDHHLAQIQYLDMKTYLPGDILTKVDRASMAHSLEVRVPLLDHPFVEWAGRVSPALKLQGREGKFLFKKALETHVPHDILYRDKMGFGVPVGQWFRGPLRNRIEGLADNPALAESGLFERSAVQAMVRAHLSGARDYTQPLWALVMFAGFLENVHQIESKKPQETMCREPSFT
ncbi:asparagine synthase (glutamine-hydrolysing) [Rhodothalassium salexigens DSM 2132]|uniref:asparagine synthase (glutamine-hydrolyzing) n=1 Tax=Rhodothalassium salexigens DSM 2132 TaxID=1188247 RepID=A0A4R2PCL7_RHOSA|nr:XrtA/PEP-CTERM system amidotransferase [Rhodothalassium salexigens]MBB4212042.1 asparagine synthase (glutamine-hydrolyzing) [Rhodothalassium salexigens DSM 2132]MBK1638103.1 asparagine synthetase B [Rhodothalassium salexigens DSM 2132]TCP32919.1 asparagine synthase (glutamine-hydrolysing) [Rhodothalassium salexigens DSM 2132]